MYTVQILDPDLFTAKAATRNRVRVTRWATTGPRLGSEGEVNWQPVLAVQYSIEFQDPDMGPIQWTFQETILANERGEIPSWGPMMARLDPAKVEMVHRSGTF